ncbi:MAG: histidine phosphatase family protein [Candidatus Zixiibacteriota bacterium]
MKVYLVRHALAVEREVGLPDESRGLTPEGAKSFAEVVDGLQVLGIRFDHLLHSPWLRAVETAELLMPLLEGESEVTSLLAMAPNADLVKQIKGDNVALVGHRPWMGELLALLVAGRVEDGDRYEFKKGGVAVLEGKPVPGGMRLLALYPPRALRALECG